MKFLAHKMLGTLRPVDSAGEEAMSRIKNGSLVQIEVKQPRSLQHHRLYWALVSLVWDNIDHARYPSIEDLHGAIKIAAGIRTRIELPNGEVGFMPGSIAFHKMSQDEFNSFYNTVSDLISKHFLPGVTGSVLKQEVSAMIGLDA